MSDMMTPKQYEIPEGNFGFLYEKIEKLNKRAAKIGVSPIVLTKVGEKYITVKNTGPGGVETSEKVKVILVTVVGESPKLNGWSFAAVIEHHAEGNITRLVPPFSSIPERFRTTNRICEHCKMDRRRNDTYIVVNEAGEHKQVGRSCLKDFTGHASPDALAQFAELLSMLDEIVGGFAGGGCGFGERYWDLSRVLSIASAVIRIDGQFVPKSKAEAWGKIATAQIVGNVVSPGTLISADAARELQEMYEPNSEDEAYGELVKGWAAEMDVDSTNDYLWNCKVLARMECINWRNFGLAVSMVGAYQREVAKMMAAETEAKTPRPVSQFVGTIGKREEFTLTLKKIFLSEGAFGTTKIHFWEDLTGNKLTWFSTSGSDFEEGNTYVVKATPKKHEAYKGTDQTLINRVVLVKAVNAPATEEVESLIGMLA